MPLHGPVQEPGALSHDMPCLARSSGLFTVLGQGLPIHVFGTLGLGEQNNKNRSVPSLRSTT